MHVNDLIEFMSTTHGVLECSKLDGATRITLTLLLEDTEIQAVGGDIDSVFAGITKQYNRHVKNRGVVKITKGRRK